eukprot:Skav223012  [mRNA]  locus=scaffold1422:77970:78995:+ [translate_table: standard]
MYQSCELPGPVLQAASKRSEGVVMQLGEVGRSTARLTRALIELFDDLQALIRDAFLLLAALLEALLRICTCPLVECFQHRPLHETMSVLVVLVMMGTMYFAMFLCCMRTPDGWKSKWWTLVIFHKCFGLSLISYVKGVVTSPGCIPDSWKPGSVAEGKIVNLVRERKRSGELRFCSREMKYKPDRAHYCSNLQCNVLRMDHYCPWMSNCIGHFNYKYFLQFLAYTVVSSSLSFFVMLKAIYDQVFVPGTTVTILGCAGLAGLLASVLTPFFVFHVWMLSKNMTTIEFCEKLEAGNYISPYDAGAWANFRSVLGGNVLLWFLPVHSTPGDGTSFLRAISSTK